jgi:spore germination protein KC
MRLLMLALACCSFGLTGCWNRIEINDLGISIAAALDKADHGQVRFSEQVALPGQMGGGKSSSAQNKPYYTFSGIGLNIGDAIQNLQTQMSRRLFLAHRRVFLISENIAQQDIRQYLDELSRNPQSRLRTSVAITKGDAFPYLQVQYPFERIPAEGLRKVMFGVQSNYKMDLKDLVIMLATPGADAFLPFIELNKPSPNAEPKFKADGLAVFHHGRMVGSLGDDQSDGVLWLREQMKKDSLSAIVPKHPGNISCDLLRSHSDFKVTLQNGHPVMNVYIQPEGDVAENDTQLNLNDPQNVKLVEQAFSKVTQSQIESALDLLQHKYDADIVRFGDRVHHAFPHEWPTLIKRWDQEFAKMPVHVTVEWKIRRVGMTGPSASER